MCAVVRFCAAQLLLLPSHADLGTLHLQLERFFQLLPWPENPNPFAVFLLTRPAEDMQGSRFFFRQQLFGSLSDVEDQGHRSVLFLMLDIAVVDDTQRTHLDSSFSAKSEYVEVAAQTRRDGHALEHQHDRRICAQFFYDGLSYLLADFQEWTRIGPRTAADQFAFQDQQQWRDPEYGAFVDVAQVVLVVEYVGGADGNYLLVLVVERPAQIEEACIRWVAVGVRRKTAATGEIVPAAP